MSLFKAHPPLARSWYLSGVYLGIFQQAALPVSIRYPHKWTTYMYSWSIKILLLEVLIIENIQCFCPKQILTLVVFSPFFFFILERLAMAGGTHPLLHDVNIYVAQDCTGWFFMENLLPKKFLQSINKLLVRLINYSFIRRGTLNTLIPRSTYKFPRLISIHFL